ncbi:DNA cytosine methyltransferase [Teredinibacter waterburyi]|uniref:DNA cytosine methyltransferase n=1 Tax=Teredinibacter waterburyi TaxID=1500538 RepID=UPI00165FF1CA|nr:DNA cytosine methyltransferase [Teredinibacter waterburyi]
MKAIEMCAGAGGQALGLHNAGFKHSALIELDEFAHKTLHYNNCSLNLGWENILHEDLKLFVKQKAKEFVGSIDLLAGGVPCPPFSKAGLQLGKKDERDLFPTAIEIARKIKPTAIMLENVQGLAEAKFAGYRSAIITKLRRLGFEAEWKLLQASDFGVPQLRPRLILVAIKKPFFHHFEWPKPHKTPPPTVGEALYDLMSSNNWEGAQKWKEKANRIAPTLVGGSKKHGGPDLGPTRAKRQWHELGVNGHRLAYDHEIPCRGFKGVELRGGGIREGYENMPLLNVRMAARLQGFPDSWEFVGSKTHAYRQVGNAFPPPVAEAVGRQILRVLKLIKVKERRGL